MVAAATIIRGDTFADGNSHEIVLFFFFAFSWNRLNEKVKVFCPDAMRYGGSVLVLAFEAYGDLVDSD